MTSDDVRAFGCQMAVEGIGSHTPSGSPSAFLPAVVGLHSATVALHDAAATIPYREHEAAAERLVSARSQQAHLLESMPQRAACDTTRQHPGETAVGKPDTELIDGLAADDPPID
jgi:hypothetical protein